jgi:hypothetical protein
MFVTPGLMVTLTTLVRHGEGRGPPSKKKNKYVRESVTLQLMV